MPKVINENYTRELIRAKLGTLVDRLGQVKADIADLKANESSLRDQIVAELTSLGEKEFDGELFHAIMSQGDVKQVDWKAVVAALPSSARLTRLINANTSVEERTTLKVNSR